MEGTSKNQETISSKMDQQFNFQTENVVYNNNNNAAETDELQLSLGLSMNGTFGVDPSCKKKLKRSSSISNLAVSDAVDAARDENAPMARSSSVPVENEEEVRRRKADQFAARKLEVRKKRNWKKSARGIKEESGSNETNAVSVERTDQVGVIVNEGSVGSQKTGSSGVSVQQIEGATQNGGVKSPSSVRSDQVQVEPVAPMRANAPDRHGRRNNGLVSTPLLHMPYVSTRGGENRVRGFLYKYEKGDDVKIVCVCHGLFLSPAEFVRHGGGGDVENPLRHIIVSTVPLF